MRPSRIITAVEKELRTSFWAVPALSRVEPVRASGPVSHGEQVVGEAAPARPAGWPSPGRSRHRARGPAASAPRTKGVRPEAVSPTAMSPGRSAPASARPRSASSSTFSTARSRRLGTAGVVGDDQPGGGVERRQQLGGVEHGEPAGGAGAEVVDGAAGPERRRPRASTSAASSGSTSPRPGRPVASSSLSTRSTSRVGSGSMRVVPGWRSSVGALTLTSLLTTDEVSFLQAIESMT